MIVRYFAYYRKDVGCKEEVFPLAPLSVLDLLKILTEKYDKKVRFPFLTHDGSDIHPDVILMIDGRNIDFIDGINSIIKETAIVSIFPRIAGG